MKKNKEEFSIKDLFSIFLPKLWIIVLVAFVFALLMGSYSAFMVKDSYSSDSTLVVYKRDSQVNASDISVTSSRIQLYKVIIFSDSFMNIVLSHINTSALYAAYDVESWNLSENYIKNVVSINQPYEEVEAFKISVTTNNPDKSYVIADAVSYHIENSLTGILPSEEGVIFSQRIDPPNHSLVPNNKNVTRNTILGFAVGVVLSMVVIFVLSLFDVTIRDKKKLEDNFDIPVLGVIPKFEDIEEASK